MEPNEVKAVENYISYMKITISFQEAFNVREVREILLQINSKVFEEKDK